MAGRPPHDSPPPRPPTYEGDAMGMDQHAGSWAWSDMMQQQLAHQGQGHQPAPPPGFFHHLPPHSHHQPQPQQQPQAFHPPLAHGLAHYHGQHPMQGGVTQLQLPPFQPPGFPIHFTAAYGGDGAGPPPAPTMLCQDQAPATSHHGSSTSASAGAVAMHGLARPPVPMCSGPGMNLVVACLGGAGPAEMSDVQKDEIRNAIHALQSLITEDNCVICQKELRQPEGGKRFCVKCYKKLWADVKRYREGDRQGAPSTAGFRNFLATVRRKKRCQAVKVAETAARQAAAVAERATEAERKAAVAAVGPGDVRSGPTAAEAHAAAEQAAAAVHTARCDGAACVRCRNLLIMEAFTEDELRHLLERGEPPAE